MNSQSSQLIVGEQWRDIPGYEGLYQVSDHGRVFNCATQRFIGKTPSINQHIAVGIYKDGQKKAYGVHQLVMLAFVGACPEGLEVNHINAVKYDNHLSNLEYVTHQQNIQHAADMGVFKKKNHNTKHEVLRLYRLGWQSSKIAEHLGITYQYVQLIQAKNGISVRKEKPQKGPYQHRPTHVAPRSENRERIVKMYREGMTTTAIARELGITPQQASTALSFWIPKEERRNKRRTAEEAALNRQRIHELASQGHSIKAIAQLTDSHYNYVSKLLQDAAQ